MKELNTYLICNIAWYFDVKTAWDMEQMPVKIVRVSPVDSVIVTVINKLHVHQLAALGNVQNLHRETLYVALSFFGLERK